MFARRFCRLAQQLQRAWSIGPRHSWACLRARWRGSCVAVLGLLHCRGAGHAAWSRPPSSSACWRRRAPRAPRVHVRRPVHALHVGSRHSRRRSKRRPAHAAGLAACRPQALPHRFAQRGPCLANSRAPLHGARCSPASRGALVSLRGRAHTFRLATCRFGARCARELLANARKLQAKHGKWLVCTNFGSGSSSRGIRVGSAWLPRGVRAWG